MSGCSQETYGFAVDTIPVQLSWHVIIKGTVKFSFFGDPLSYVNRQNVNSATSCKYNFVLEN